MSSIMIPITITTNGVDQISFVTLSGLDKYNKIPDTDTLVDGSFFGTHNGFKFRITNRGGYFCGYILIGNIPQLQNIFSEMICEDDEFENFINEKIYAYQGITYISANRNVIGFDCAHLTDIIVKNKKIQSMHCPHNATYKTYSFVRNQCVKTIDSIIEFWQKSMQDYAHGTNQTQVVV